MKTSQKLSFFFKKLYLIRIKTNLEHFERPTQVLPTTNFGQETGIKKWRVIKILKERRKKNESKKQKRKKRMSSLTL